MEQSEKSHSSYSRYRPFAKGLEAICDHALVQESVAAVRSSAQDTLREKDWPWHFNRVLHARMAQRGIHFNLHISNIGINIIWNYLGTIEKALRDLTPPQTVHGHRAQIIQAVTQAASYGAALNNDIFIAEEHGTEGLGCGLREGMFAVDKLPDGRITIRPKSVFIVRCADLKKRMKDELTLDEQTHCPALGAMQHIVTALMDLFCESRNVTAGTTADSF